MTIISSVVATTLSHRLICALTAVFLATAYVLSLYAIPSRVRALPRDDPVHILWRIAAVATVTVLSPLVVFFLAPQGSPPLFNLFGAAQPCLSPYGGLSPLALVGVLFAGPLVAAAARAGAGAGSAFAGASISSSKATILALSSPTLTTLRALVVAPVSEEVVFRAAALPLIIAAGASHAGATAASAMLFAAAHAHHYFEHVTQGMSPRSAARTVGMQISFTGIFALLAAHSFLRSGSLLGVVAAHALANAMGLPDCSFWTTKHHPAHWARYLVAAAYITGILGFVWLLAMDKWPRGECALSPSPYT